MAWQTPKTDWTGADGVRDTDMIRIEGNTQHLYENKAELTDFEALKRVVDDTLFNIANRVPIQAVNNGSTFGLYENGILVPFIKLTDNYEDSGRILVVRKDCLYVSQLLSGSDRLYDGCFVDTWVNGSYPEMLNAAVQSVLVAIPVKTWGTFGESTINRKAFLLSMNELQMTSNEGIPVEGSSISYFNSNSRRIATLDGTPIGYWTRSINSAQNIACYVTQSGSYSTGQPNSLELGIRPAFTLPGTLEVTAGVPNASNVMATAEVI